MKFNRLLLIITLFASSFILKAQDIHFTQFGYVPLTINPAQTGLFEGTYRIGGLYRGQYFSAGRYKTPVFFADLPISGFKKSHWIGLGLNVHQDKAGVAALRTNLIGLNGAYHIGLDKKFNSVFSIGIQANFNQRNVDKNALTFQDAILSGGASADQSAITGQNKSYTDVNIGVNYRNRPDKKTGFNIGASVEHVLSPKYNLIDNKGQISKLPMRINAYGTMDLTLSKSLTLHPAALLRVQAGQTETMVQGLVGVKVDPKKNMVVKAGLGYRVADALQFLGGIELGDLRVGVAYDFTASKLRSDSRSQDGFEIAIGYIGKIFKTEKPTPILLCPRY
jgi:type IX secretion system PorP/SprF family membrane protein